MRRGLAFALVALLLAAAAEVMVFAAVAQVLGAGWAVLLLAGCSVAGVLLLRREGVRGWRRFRAAAAAGRPPGQQVSDGLTGLVGALLLAVPGFVSAAVGVLLLLPPVRALARRGVLRVAQRRLSGAVAGDLFGPRRVRVQRGDPVGEPESAAGPGPTIEGEIVDAVAARGR